MANTLVRVFDRLADAEQAREQLLRNGFPDSSINMTSTWDEAGPVQGNFVVDRKEDTNPDSPSFLDRLHEGDPDAGTDISRRPDTSAPQRMVQRGTIVMTVDAGSEELQSRASSILGDAGATDVDELVHRRNRES